MEGLMELGEELVKIDGVVATIITGIFTFFVTKYTYHKNIPLDKFEKAYDRVYYPIYCIINSDIEIKQSVDKCNSYLMKYKKYVDRSTLKAFQYLKKSIYSENEKKAYDIFKSNIYEMDTKLRRRLGYLEPNFLNMYTYSSPAEKRLVRILLEAIGIYASALSATTIQNEYIDVIMYLIFGFSFIGFLFEIVIIVCRFVWKLVIKIYEKIKNILKEN